MPTLPPPRPSAVRTAPPRPTVTSQLTPPVFRPASAAPPPRSLRVSAVLWFAGCAAGMFGLAAALVDSDALRDKLTALATENDPTASAALVRDGVWATTAVLVGVASVLVVATLVGTALLLRGRAWSRWLLLVTGLATLPAVDVGQSIVAGGADLDRIGLLLQAGLVVPALVALFLPSSGSWLRGGD